MRKPKSGRRYNTLIRGSLKEMSEAIETLRQMVAAGVGITLLPALASRGAYGQARGIAIRAFARPIPSRRIGAVWRKSSARASAIAALLDQIARHSGLA